MHEAGEFKGNKIADTVTKSNDNIEKQEPIEEKIIPPKKERKY